MKTLREWNEAYMELSGGAEAMAEDYEAIRHYNMHESSAIYHGQHVRTPYMPKILRQSDFDLFTRDMTTLYGIFRKVTDRYFDDPEYRKIFGLTRTEEELILKGRRDISYIPMARIDIFYDEDTSDYKFCEFNTDGTSAMNEDRELHNSQKHSRAYKAFVERYGAENFELFDTWVDTVLKIYREKAGGKDPVVAIADYLECGLVHDFRVFQQRFENRGIKCFICDVRDMKYDGHDLSYKGEKIDVIYRRAVTSDVMKHLDESQAMIGARDDGNVMLLGDFHTQIVHNKEIFRMLWDDRTLEFLNEEESSYIRSHVPFTKEFTEDDRRRVIEEQGGWIIKPVDSYGAKGIYSGCDFSAEEWKEKVGEIPTRGYIMQEFNTPFITENYGENNSDCNFKKRQYYNLTGIYVYDGVPRGIYSRASLTPIISSQHGEKAMPTLLVKD